eukprot:7491735-Alexandrium_andersonii.AAC.1
MHPIGRSGNFGASPGEFGVQAPNAWSHSARSGGRVAQPPLPGQCGVSSASRDRPGVQSSGGA